MPVMIVYFSHKLPYNVNHKSVDWNVNFFIQLIWVQHCTVCTQIILILFSPV